jgi:glycosyltransferase involved in cell wall biosynthesis
MDREEALATASLGARDATYTHDRERASTRVLHLVSSGGLYGAEQVILNLARSEDVISYVGALYNARDPHLEVIDEAKTAGLRTVVFNSPGRLDVRTVFRIRRFLNDNGVDILHTHGYKADVIGFIATLSGKTKWLATNHVWHPISGKMRLYESVDALVLRFARSIVAVSREIRRDLISTNIPAANIHVIANGIDLDRFRPSRSTIRLKADLGIREDDVVVTIIGRLSPEKGHGTFLEAARRVCSRKDHVRFLIVGDGPMREELHAEAVRLNLERRVIFTGFRNDIPEIYALSDLMVNASSIEGLPMTVLEAMASKVPVIATRAGGIPDVITQNETGVLVDGGDVDALSTAIDSLIDDEPRRRRLAAAAFDHVRLSHSLKRMCDAYAQVYREVMDCS